MKVVLVSSFPAFPTTAGNRSRIRQLALAIKGLGHDLTFVYLESKWETSDDAAHVAAFGNDKYIKIGKRYWLAKLIRDLALGAAKRLLRASGVEAAYYSSLDRFRDRTFIKELSRLDVQPDVVVVEYVLDSWAFDAFLGKPRRVLDTHDAFADRHKGYVAQGIRNYWVSFRPESENAGLRRAHVVLAIQQEEAERFRQQLVSDGKGGIPELAVVGHLLTFDDTSADYRIDDSAVFLASDNPANRHAIHIFVDAILPRVVREIPGFELKLAGSICGAVGDVPNVTKLGWVEDARTIFAQTSMAINPMFAGTGMNIKLLDAMAAGVPTISTATGARGLPESLRKGVFLVADGDAAGFASAMVRLARDENLRRETGLAARADAEKWHEGQLAELNRCLVGS